MDLQAKRNKTRRLIVEFDGEPITTDYRFCVLTRAYALELEERAAREGRDSNGLLISDCVSAWDLTNGDAPFPPTYDNVMELPGVLLTAIADAIYDDLGKLTTTRQTG